MAKRQKVVSGFLKDFLESVKSYTHELIFLGQKQKKSLYHYTDLSGLNSILQNDDLWLTHSRYSNDDQEITHGYRIVKEVIDEERASSPSPNRLDFLKSLAELMKEPAPEGVYICCFCIEGNILSQWRGYGANGTGVSLKFSPQKFSDMTNQLSQRDGLMRLWKISYNEDKQKALVRKAISFAFEQKKMPPDKRARKAADALQFFIPTFKNEGFNDEKECRLIFTPYANCSVKPQFRVSRGMLVPYYSLRQLKGGKVKSPWLPLTGIRIGPSANRRLNAESAQMLLDKTGHVKVEAKVSNIPFRG